jgi:hypothetical protein
VGCESSIPRAERIEASLIVRVGGGLVLGPVIREDECRDHLMFHRLLLLYRYRKRVLYRYRKR